MPKWKKICAVYALISAVAIPVVWGVSYAAGWVDADLAQPVYLTMLIIAESVTTLLLFVAGVGLFRQWTHAPIIFPAAMGMLIYATLFGAGKFGQKGLWGILMFFLIIATTSAVLTAVYVRKQRGNV